MLTQLPDIMATLAPQHTGFTVNPQPTLYWYLSSPWPGKVEFSLNEIGVVQPLLDLKLSLDAQQKIHSLSLADYDVRLEPDKEYEWFVVIVRDPEQPSSDAFTSGTIRYQIPSKQLQARLAQTGKKQWYRVQRKVFGTMPLKI